MNSSSSDFNVSDLFLKFNEINEELQKFPTALVMTHETFEKAKKVIDVSCETHQHVNICIGSSGLGIRIETHDTIEQCMDRMMNQRPGERLQLVFDGDLPSSCFGHPYMKMAAEKFAEMYSFESHIMRYYASRITPSMAKFF